jgi:hypothetical protein
MQAALGNVPGRGIGSGGGTGGRRICPTRNSLGRDIQGSKSVLEDLNFAGGGAWLKRAGGAAAS